MLEKEGVPITKVFSKELKKKEKEQRRPPTPSSSNTSAESLPRGSIEFSRMSESQLTKTASYELTRYEKGVKGNAKATHNVMRVPADGDDDEPERCIYELTEQFYSTEKCWGRDMSPGVMEKSALALAQEVKRVAESAAARLGSGRTIVLDASAYAT